MKKAILITVCLIFISAIAHATHLRCQNGFISVGDSSAVIIIKCGQPLNMSVRDNLSGNYRGFNTNRIEEWTYVTDGFIRLITVVDGKIVKIETVGKE